MEGEERSAPTLRPRRRGGGPGILVQTGKARPALSSSGHRWLPRLHARPTIGRAVKRRREPTGSLLKLHGLSEHQAGNRPPRAGFSRRLDVLNGFHLGCPAIRVSTPLAVGSRREAGSAVFISGSRRCRDARPSLGRQHDEGPPEAMAALRQVPQEGKEQA